MSIQPRVMMVPQSKWNIKCPYPMTAEFITVHNCLPINTEVLTRTGWRTLEDVRVGDEIATVHQDDLSIEFGPVRYVQPIYLSPTIVAEHRGIEATENHRMLTTNQAKKTHKEMFMQDVRASQSAVYIPNAGFLAEERALPLDDWQIKLLVAIQADGSYIRCKYLGRHYDWTSVKIDVKKERKVARLKEILSHLNYPYNEHFDGEYTSITVKGEELKALCDTYLDNKVFNWSWLMMSQPQAELFIDELTYWDGSRVEHDCALERRYASSVQQNLDVVDAIASLNGIGTVRNKTIITFRRNLYRALGPNTHYTTNIAPVSCVTVDTGFILIRQNGVTTVVGNTANDASANNEISYMISNNREVSYHFAIDDREVVQGIPLNRNAWHAGDGGNGTGNRKTIGIEICYSLSGGDRFIKAEQLAAKFIAQLLDERGWKIDKVKKHQDWSGKYCPSRTLDMGWARFLDMISAELKALQKPVLVWTPTPAKTYNTIVDTALYDIVNGTVVRNFGAGVSLDFVEQTTYKGTTYYRTQWSKDNNVDNGVPASDLAIPTPTTDRLSWGLLPEPLTKVALRDCALVDLKSGEIKQTYEMGSLVTNLVDKTEQDGETYYRTEVIRNQKKSYGIPSYQLGDYVEPEDNPPYPDDVVVEPPEESEMTPASTTNWVMAFISIIINFIKGLFGRGDK